jgi:hypothetical protein
MSIVNTVLILSAYWIYVLRKLRIEGPELTEDLKFWGVTILIFIAAAVVLRIIMEILLNIVNAVVYGIRTGGKEIEDPTITDERDKKIELKGEQISFIFVGLGFVISMVSLALGYPAYVMINIQFSSFFIADLIGSFSQLYFYQRGA